MPESDRGHQHQRDALHADRVGLGDDVLEGDAARQQRHRRAPGQKAQPTGVTGGAGAHAADGPHATGQQPHHGPMGGFLLLETSPPS